MGALQAAAVDIEGQVHVENHITVMVSLAIDFRARKGLDWDQGCVCVNES